MFVEHSSSSFAEPGHWLSPQILRLRRTPVPQDCEHEDQAPHCLHDAVICQKAS